MNKKITCKNCGGIGEVYIGMKACHVCKGTGQTSFEHSLTGRIGYEICSQCKGDGSGLMVFNQCNKCKGKGYRDWLDEMIRPGNNEPEPVVNGLGNGFLPG